MAEAALLAGAGFQAGAGIFGSIAQYFTTKAQYNQINQYQKAQLDFQRQQQASQFQHQLTLKYLDLQAAGLRSGASIMRQHGGDAGPSGKGYTGPDITDVTESSSDDAGSKLSSDEKEDKAPQAISSTNVDVHLEPSSLIHATSSNPSPISMVFSPDAQHIVAARSMAMASRNRQEGLVPDSSPPKAVASTTNKTVVAPQATVTGSLADDRLMALNFKHNREGLSPDSSPAQPVVSATNPTVAAPETPGPSSVL